MAAFGSLTAEQQKLITDFSMMLRGYVGEMAKCLDHLSAINDSYVGVVGPVLNLLTSPDNAIAIPDNTGLAATLPLTPYQMGLLMNDMQALLVTNTDAKRQVWAQACGPGNLVG